MFYFWAALFGLIWGACAAVINTFIAKKALARQEKRSAVRARRLQTMVTAAALLLIVLLRNELPFSYETALVTALIASSVLCTVLLFRLKI